MSIVLVRATPKWLDLGLSLNILNGVAGGSISAWVNSANVIGLDQSCLGVSIGPPPGTTNSSRLRLGLSLALPFLIGRTLDTDSPTTVIGASGVTANVWAHLVGTFDGPTRIATLYLNGVAVGSGTFTNSTAGSFSATNTKNGAIGSGVSGIDTYFDGQLADVRIYNAVLTADEIMTMFAMRGHDGIRRTAGVLRLAYPMNDNATGVVCTTTNLSDVSGPQVVPHPALVTGAPVFGQSPLAHRRIAA